MAIHIYLDSNEPALKSEMEKAQKEYNQGLLDYRALIKRSDTELTPEGKMKPELIKAVGDFSKKLDKLIKVANVAERAWSQVSRVNIPLSGFKIKGISKYG